MLLSFELQSEAGPSALRVELSQLVIAGWAGRDAAAIEHHIQELAALGVPRPSRVPLYYRVAANQLTQEETVQVVGPHSSGEAEAFVFAHGGQLYVSVASDHTDRQLEAHSVALSKQVCAKPVARVAWRLDEVLAHWDQLQLQSSIIENGKEVAYQQGELSSLRSATDLIVGHAGDGGLPDGTGMTCGTVAVIGGIRPAGEFRMALVDPVLNRRIEHRYTLDVLPEVQ